MTTFIVTERQNINSHRDGEKIQAHNLSAAKRIASRNQLFCGTVLTIDNECGNRISSKEDGVWTDQLDAYLYN